MIENKRKLLDKISIFRLNIFEYYSNKSTTSEDFLDHVTFENGAQPPKDMHIYQYKNGYVRFIQNRDYDSNNYLTYIPISNKNHLCEEDDIMMDKYGDAGAVRYGIKGAFNVALLKIIPNNNYEKEYIRDFLSQSKIKNILYQSSQASTRPSLNESTFKGIMFPCLEESIVRDYNNKLTSILNLSKKINKDINILETIKSNLLNKYFQ